MVFYGFSMVCYGFSVVCYGFSMVCYGFSHGFSEFGRLKHVKRPAALSPTPLERAFSSKV